MITNICVHENGFNYVTIKLDGIKKEQTFFIHPSAVGGYGYQVSLESKFLILESDSRIGFLNLVDGVLTLSGSHRMPNTAHYAKDKKLGKLSTYHISTEDAQTVLNFAINNTCQ